MGKTHWRRKQQLTLVFLPGKLQGWESDELQSMGSEELDMTEHTYVCAYIALTLEFHFTELADSSLNIPTIMNVLRIF